MHISQAEISEKLLGAAELPLRRVFFAERQPLPMPPYLCGRQVPARFMLPLSGKKRIVFASSGQTVDVEMEPGEAIFAPDGSWIWEDWSIPHEMIGVIFWPKWVRAIYIDQRIPATERHGPDVYFHSSRPIDGPGRSVLDALLAGRLEQRIAVPLVEALLHLVIRMIAEDSPEAGAKSRASWQSIDCYLRDNWNMALDRGTVARIFKLHPVHISRLCRRFTGQGFGAYVAEMRLGHAAELLRNTRMTVDEISFECGYGYSSHFVRCFKQRYGLTPTAFRNKRGDD